MNDKLIPSKLLSLKEACMHRDALRYAGKNVVLTNGCFDLLHVGHVAALEAAKAFGDSLWVAINSDVSVKSLKGDSRPIFDETERAYMLSALEAVDGVFIFNGQRLADEILAFKPDIYIKSGDYSIDKLDASERAALEKVGAEMKFVNFVNGYSTSSIIEKIRQ